MGRRCCEKDPTISKGGSGSGGGGGSTSLNTGNCTVVSNCRPGTLIEEGRIPCGGCGPGPIVIVPEEVDMDSNGFYYSRIAELDSILSADPYALNPCDSLTMINLQTYGGMYQNVASFHPDIAVRYRLDSIRSANGYWVIDNFNFQNIEDAFGATVNCDYFPIQITQFPINPATNARFTPEEFLEFFRVNINKFITPPVGVSFNRSLSSQVNDCNKWNLSGLQAKGALNHIHIPGPIGISNDGTVILSDYTHINTGNSENHNFMFSTIETPFDNEHPVAGNRQFGVFNNASNPSQYTFYIMGVDRIWDIGTAFAHVFVDGCEASDNLWNNVMTNLKENVDSTGASTYYAQSSCIARASWNDVKEYLQKDIDFATLKLQLGC